MISLSISVFGFVQLTVAVKFVLLPPHVRKYLLLKIANNTFSQPLTANKNSFQPLAALQSLDPAANRKPYT